MTGLGQSLRDPQSLMIGGKPRGNIPVSDCGRVCRSGTEVSSTRRRSPWVNLRRSLRVGAWNVLSQREDDHLSLLSSELKHLGIGIAALSEVRRPDSGEICMCLYAYKRFGPALVRTGFWGGCRRDQAAVHRLGMSISLTLMLQMMPSSLRRLEISFWGPRGAE